MESTKDMIKSESVKEEISFSDLYKDYNGLVRSVLFKICGAHDLDDLVQDAFIRIWKGLSGFKDQSNIGTWIYRISVNVAHDYFRSRGKKVFEVELNEQISSNSNQDNTHTQRDLVHKALSKMNLKHRMVLVMFHMEELSISEVANVLNEPEGTIKSRLHFARSEMKMFLEKNGVKL